MDPLGWLERWALQRSFRRLVSPGVIELLEKAPRPRAPNVDQKHFQYVIVHVDEKNADEVPALISKLGIVFTRHAGPLPEVASSLMVGVLGLPHPANDSLEARLELVTALQAAGGDRIRIAHGQCYGLSGLLGDDQFLSYEIIIPGFSQILQKLFEAEFGTATPIEPSGNGKPETGNQ